MPTEPASSWAATCAGLGVAVLLLLDLLATRQLSNWEGHAALEMGAACIALGFSGPAWLRAPRAPDRPAERGYGAPSFVVGAPHIDLQLWAAVRAAMRNEPPAMRTVQSDEREPAPRYALALVQATRRHERRERRSVRRRATCRA